MFDLRVISGLMVAIFLCLGVARAELPPTVYQDLQKKAPEVLKIRADEVISKPAGILDRSNWSEIINATVIEVIRSTTGVKAGAKITISYDRQVFENGRVGPSPPPQLKKGEEYTAFLAKSDGGQFSIVARGMSFSPMK